MKGSLGEMEQQSNSFIFCRDKISNLISVGVFENHRLRGCWLFNSSLTFLTKR